MRVSVTSVHASVSACEFVRVSACARVCAHAHAITCVCECMCA